LTIAISTSGKSPALAKQIRKQMEEQFDTEYKTFLTLMGRVRDAVLKRGLSQEENSRMFHQIVQSDILKALGRNDWKAVEGTLQRLLPDDLAPEELFQGLDRSRGT
jgi:precorrin-2 dehydrogenase/sirohydrochlorin ferrochelatase